MRICTKTLKRVQFERFLNKIIEKKVMEACALSIPVKNLVFQNQKCNRTGGKLIQKLSRGKEKKKKKANRDKRFS